MLGNPRAVFNSIILVFCLGCNNSPNIDRSAVREEMANRELKRVTEAEILNEATQIGRNLTSLAETLLEKKSKMYLENHSHELVTKPYVKWIHDLDSLEKVYEAQISYLSLITASDAQMISPIEEELLDAYVYNIEQNISLTENIQKTEKDLLLYNKPIVLNSSSCLRCHGKPAEDISEKMMASIKEHYPNSKVQGFGHGSVLGVWSVKLSQKKIVQGL